MKAEEFAEHTLTVASKFRWIKRIESKVFRNRVRVRLWLNNSFVDVYYNSEKWKRVEGSLGQTTCV